MLITLLRCMSSSEPCCSRSASAPTPVALPLRL